MQYSTLRTKRSFTSAYSAIRLIFMPWYDPTRIDRSYPDGNFSTHSNSSESRIDEAEKPRARGRCSGPRQHKVGSWPRIGSHSEATMMGMGNAFSHIESQTHTLRVRSFGKRQKEGGKQVWWNGRPLITDGDG